MQKCIKMTLSSFGGLETIWGYIEKNQILHSCSTQSMLFTGEHLR